MKCLVKARHDPSRRERCDLRRRGLPTIPDNSPSLTNRSYRTLRDGLLDGTFQAFHAWTSASSVESLPSSGPFFGTNTASPSNKADGGR